MIFSKITITILTIIIAVSIIFANLAHQLDVDVIPKRSDEITDLPDTLENNVHITDTHEHLMWFLQVLHYIFVILLFLNDTIEYLHSEDNHID